MMSSGSVGLGVRVRSGTPQKLSEASRKILHRSDTSCCDARRLSRRSESLRVICNSRRQQKNPRDYKDFDEIRRKLKADGGWQGQFSLGGLLQNFSEATFGAAKQGASLYRALLDWQVKNGQKAGKAIPTLEFQGIDVSDAGQVASDEVDAARTFWESEGFSAEEASGLATASAAVTVRYQLQVPASERVASLADPAQPSSSSSRDGVPETAARVKALAESLMCTPFYFLRLALREPVILAVNGMQASRRMVWLKGLVPGADVMRLVQNQPTFLMLSDAQMAGAEATVQRLRDVLQGAPLDIMIQDHPLLILEDLEEALVEFRELWPEELVDEEALGECDPWELVLAVLALSPQGAPKDLSRWR